MKLVMGALLAGVSLYGGAELAETFVPVASEQTAYIQGRMISDRAFLESEMGTESWEAALKTAVDSTRNNEGQLRLEGTTVVWDNGVDVWCIALPTFESLVEPEKCS
jgi:hypothetical protein